jgi:hypothetical protein
MRIPATFLCAAFLCAAPCLLPFTVFARQLPDIGKMKPLFAAQMKQEQDVLRTYSWKARTEVRVKDEVKSVLLELMRYDGNGKLQRTVIGGNGSEKGESKQRGVVGRIKQQKTDDYQKKLKSLIESYSSLSPDRIATKMDSAAFQPGKGDMQDAIRILIPDIVNKGDSLSLWIDSKTRQKRKMQIQTKLDGDLVEIETKFGTLPEGVQYPSLITFDIKAKNIRGTRENFDYAKERKNE